MRAVAGFMLVAACGATRHDAPPAPLDVVAWLDERDCITGFRCRPDLLDEASRPPPRVDVAKTHRATRRSL